MSSERLVDTVSVVLAGNFNPAIFSPGWLAMNDLVSKMDADKALIEIIHPEVCHFTVGEFVVHVDLEHFSVSCVTNRHEMARDLVEGVFGSFLTHTPISAIGLNREIHFDTGDFKIRDAVGKRLAPTDPWGEWGATISGPDEMTHEHGGLVRLIMRQGLIGHKHKGYTLVDVQPSPRPQLATSGIYVLVNNHFQLSLDGKMVRVSDYIETIREEWAYSLDKADFIVEQLQNVAISCKSELGM